MSRGGQKVKGKRTSSVRDKYVISGTKSTQEWITGVKGEPGKQNNKAAYTGCFHRIPVFLEEKVASRIAEMFTRTLYILNSSRARQVGNTPGYSAMEQRNPYEEQDCH
jgi:hypothetical protein